MISSLELKQRIRPIERDLNTKQNFEHRARLAVEKISLLKVLLFFMLHSFVALIIRQNGQLALIYSITVIAVGLMWAVRINKLEKIAYICSYITGCEVLWRMTGGAYFSEIGKYGTILILAITIFKTKKRSMPFLLFVYFILLLPSVFITIQNNTLELAKDYTSFYLSGPCAILMYGWFYSSVRLTLEKFLRILIAYLAPVIGIATITLYGILTNSDIVFTTESNFETSGGYGPNQVSSVLGLGALTAFFILIISNKNRGLKTLSTILILFLASLTAITFSRGGIYLFIIGSLVCLIFLFIRRKIKLQISLTLFLLVLIGAFVFPIIDTYTGGNLYLRFMEDSSTHRLDYVETEYELWQENPIFGVGIGESRHFREEAAAHTEISRVVAEHGTFGLIALLVLLITGVVQILESKDAYTQALRASFVCWLIIFMIVNALRLVAPALVFGLAFAKLNLDEDSSF